MEFSPQINKFQTLGTYDYKFDEVGNVIASSASAEFSYNYLALPLRDAVYDTTAIESYYDVNFVEFVPPDVAETAEEQDAANEAMLQENAALTKENAELKSQLDDLVASSEDDPSAAQKEAMKQVIIDLRIKLGQGKEERDFNEEFPYTVKTAE